MSYSLARSPLRLPGSADYNMIITILLSQYSNVIVIIVAYTIVITHILHMVSYTINLIVIPVYHNYITNPN